jgi:hypothetical protein
MAVQLDQVVPWGRSFDEYVRMFDLSDADLGSSIIDVAGGPSSFNAELHRRGGRVVSVDPLYQLTADEIRRRVNAARDTMMAQVRQQLDQFTWDFIRSPEHLEQLRLGAMEQFLEDFRPDTRHRYVAASLPDLSVGRFDLALCSHFLFLYADRLDEDFHVRSVRSMLSLAPQIRIFPVTDLAGSPPPQLEAVRRAFATRVVRVPYEFLRGANQMLVVTRPPSWNR